MTQHTRESCMQRFDLSPGMMDDLEDLYHERCSENGNVFDEFAFVEQVYKWHESGYNRFDDYLDRNNR